MSISRLVLRMYGPYSVSTELAYEGRIETEEDQALFKEAIKTSLGDLIKIARWCHPGARLKKIEAMIYDMAIKERFRSEPVPITLEKLQERLDAEVDAVRPFVTGAESEFDKIPAQEHKKLARTPRKPAKVMLPGTGGGKTKVQREVKKLDKPEDFLAREAS